MKITGSSAIAEVNFKDDSNVGIIFTSQDKEYMFKATDIDLVTRDLDNYQKYSSSRYN